MSEVGPWEREPHLILVSAIGVQALRRHLQLILAFYQFYLLTCLLIS